MVAVVQKSAKTETVTPKNGRATERYTLFIDCYCTYTRGLQYSLSVCVRVLRFC